MITQHAPAGNAGRAAPYRNAGATLALFQRDKNEHARGRTHDRTGERAELTRLRRGNRRVLPLTGALRVDSGVGSGKGVVPGGGAAFRWGAAAGSGSLPRTMRLTPAFQ